MGDGIVQFIRAYRNEWMKLSDITAYLLLFIVIGWNETTAMRSSTCPLVLLSTKKGIE